MEKNGTFDSPATALASKVLPVPEGTSKMPFGIDAPISLIAIRIMQILDDFRSDSPWPHLHRDIRKLNAV